MTKFVVAALAATLMSAFGAGSAGATIVYEKKDGVYVADDKGKNTRLLVPGEKQPTFAPDRRTLVYTDAGGTLFSMPLAGGTATRIALGTTCPKKDSCVGSFAPDSSALAIVDAKQNLIYAKLDGSSPVLLAAGVQTVATFSPDSQRIVFDQDPDSDDLTTLATVPISGPGATALSLRFAMLPIWTNAGIATTTMSISGSSVRLRLVIVDDRGTIKKTLSSHPIKDPDNIGSGRGIEFPIMGLPTGLLSAELTSKTRAVIRLYSLNGKVKARRPVSSIDEIQSVSASGKTMLVVGRKGRLSAMSMKSGKSRTLVSSGVKSALRTSRLNDGGRP